MPARLSRPNSAHDHQVRRDPDDGEGDEIRRPDPPRRDAVEIRFRQRVEEEQRDRQREHELGQLVANPGGEEADARRGVAEPDQPEDRDDDDQRLGQLLRARSLDAGRLLARMDPEASGRERSAIEVASAKARGARRPLGRGGMRRVDPHHRLFERHRALRRRGHAGARLAGVRDGAQARGHRTR